MRILIDIGHPAHVHLFKNFARQMIEKGHEFLFTCREKEITSYLLSFYGFDFKVIGEAKKGIIKKSLSMISFDSKVYNCAKKFGAELLLSHGSIYASHAAFFLNIPHIAFEDTGNFEQVFLYKPFTNFILTPSVFPLKYGRKQISYNGYHEIAYLHPDVYSPDETVKRHLGINNEEKYAILRFTSWNATHDKFKKGISDSVKRRLIETLLSFNLKVFISSEIILSDEFKSYQLKIPPEYIFDAMYFSDIVIGDSQTMVAEAGILGVPAIRFNELVGSNHGYHHSELQNKYKLIFNYNSNDETDFINKVVEIISNTEYKSIHRTKLENFYLDKINVTDFLVNFIEKNYG